MAMDDRLLDTQFGFRAEKSTTDPLHIVRRIQDMFEAKGDEAYILLLDWEKAFDKVSKEGLDDALRRMGVTDHYRQVIGDIYSAPQFLVGSWHQELHSGSELRHPTGMPSVPISLPHSTHSAAHRRQGGGQEGEQRGPKEQLQQQVPSHRPLLC